MESLYRSILKHAWKITKKYKFLWIFGIFALWLGNGGEIRIFFETLDFIKRFAADNISGIFVNLFPFISFFEGSDFSSILTGIIFTLIFLIFLLLGLWLVVVSQTAIIQFTNATSDKKELRFKDVLKSSIPHFLPVLGLNLLSVIFVTVLVFSLLLPALLIVVSMGGKFALLLSILIWVIFLPLAAIISFVMKYAINFLLIKKEKFLDSISKAWILFKSNWLVSIEMALAILVINALVGLVIIYLSLAFVGSYDQIELLVVYALNNQIFDLVLFNILPLVIISLFLGSLLAVFQTVAWTLLFKKLISGKRYSKLIRLVTSLSNYMKADNQVTKISDIQSIKPKKIKRRPGRPKKKGKKVKK